MLWHDIDNAPMKLFIKAQDTFRYGCSRRDLKFQNGRK